MRVGGISLFGLGLPDLARLAADAGPESRSRTGIVRDAMPACTTFAEIPMSELLTRPQTAAGDWLWDGYLAPGNITLLTGQ